LIKHKIPTPRSELFKSEKAAFHLDFPVIIKPVHEDGGIGISGSSVVHGEVSLRKKVKEILTLYKQPALVEEFIDGREVSVSVIGNGKEIEVLPLFELVFNFPPGVPKIRSYESKWIEDSMEFKQTLHKVPAEIDKKTAAQIRKEAIKAFKLTGCQDYARIDFRLKGNKPYVLEVNPNPCLYPVDATIVFCAKAAGYTYDEIILKLFEIARKRYS